MANASSTKFVADLTNYKDRTGSRIPEGEYLFRVDDAELTKARSGNQMVVVTLEVLHGEYAGETVIERLTLSAAAMFRVVNFLKALGIPTPKKRISLDTRRFVGRRVKARVQDGEPYRGNVKSEVVEFLRAPKADDSGGDEFGDITDDSAEDLKDVMDDSAEAEDILEDVSEDESDEEVEEKPKKKAAKKSATKRKPEPVVEDDEDDYDLDDGEEIDLDDLTV